jgi:hypothetical protein
MTLLNIKDGAIVMAQKQVWSGILLFPKYSRERQTE